MATTIYLFIFASVCTASTFDLTKAEVTSNVVNSEAVEDVLEYLINQLDINEIDVNDGFPSVDNFNELVQYWGYKAEKVEVTTEDGYILGMHHIIGYNNGSTVNMTGRPVALLNHGFLASSASFVYGPVHQSLAFQLFERGYDVWLGNTRGNFYSKKHKTFKVCDGKESIGKFVVQLFKCYNLKKCKFSQPCSDASYENNSFWDFGIEESAMKDIPAEIDYILNHTHTEKINYIGHSTGTTQYLIMLAMRPQYNSKIEKGILLAPVSFLSNSKGIAKLLGLLAEEIGQIYTMYLGYDVLPYLPTLMSLLTTICEGETPNKPMVGRIGKLVCDLALPVIGISPFRFNRTMLPLYMQFIPQSTSPKTIYHLAQLITNQGDFLMYDYTELKNNQTYGQPHPPAYPLKHVTAPTAIFVGDTDHFGNVIDSQKLENELVDVIHYEVLSSNHVDFVSAQDANQGYYQKVFDILEKQPGPGPTEGPTSGSGTSSTLKGIYAVILTAFLTKLIA